MSLFRAVQVINDGLFDDQYRAYDLREILSNGTQRVSNWNRIRPALVALREMPWFELESEWGYFLDVTRYPVGQELDLRPDEVSTFLMLLDRLVDQAQEPMRILSSVQPDAALTDVSVVVDVQDVPGLVSAMEHVSRTVQLASVGDAIRISSFQAGSLEIFFEAGQASRYALQLAIYLAKILVAPNTRSKVPSLKRLLSRRFADVEMPDDDDILKDVHDEVKDSFWESAEEPLKGLVESVGGSIHEAKTKVGLAADEIYRNAEQSSCDWQLPTAVIMGLPGGLSVALNYENPMMVGRVVREIAGLSEGSRDKDAEI